MIGERIKERRLALGFSGSQLAKLVNITQPYISAIERGEREPARDVLMALASALETSVAFLIGETQESSPLGVDVENYVATSDKSPQLLGEHTNSGNIILEFGEGQNQKRCILPPTPESYRFIAEQMDKEVDPRLQAIVKMWEHGDEAQKDAIFVALCRNQREEAVELSQDEGMPRAKGA